jgi:electron transport complex protein RnfD
MQPIPIGDWLAKTSADAVSGATPLALQKFEQITTPVNDMLFGMTSGSAGETSALLILLGGIYLSVRKMMNWRIPAAVLVGAVVVAAPFWLMDSARYPDPLFVLFSGGLMLGAVFMASDMVASPVTPKGIWIYGLFIGGLTTIIRLFGGLTEGVMYAILLGNVLSPIISSYTQPTVFGAGRKHE